MWNKVRACLMICKHHKPPKRRPLLIKAGGDWGLGAEKKMAFPSPRSLQFRIAGSREPALSLFTRPAVWARMASLHHLLRDGHQAQHRGWTGFSRSCPVTQELGRGLHSWMQDVKGIVGPPAHKTWSRDHPRLWSVTGACPSLWGKLLQEGVGWGTLSDKRDDNSSNPIVREKNQRKGRRLSSSSKNQKIYFEWL